jgi:hypothetical protein
VHILFSEQFKDLEGGLGKHVFLFGELRVLENLFKRLQTRLASCTVLHAYTQDIPGISTLANLTCSHVGQSPSCHFFNMREREAYVAYVLAVFTS